jgi:hypothetical protein
MIRRLLKKLVLWAIGPAMTEARPARAPVTRRLPPSQPPTRTPQIPHPERLPNKRARRAAGICVRFQCGIPAAEGVQECEAHRAESRLKQELRHIASKDRKTGLDKAGVAYNALRGGTPHAIYSRKRYYALKKKGLCVACGSAQPHSGHVRCDRCHAKLSASDLATETRGRGRSPGKQGPAVEIGPYSGERSQTPEAIRAREVRNSRIASGLCARCGEARPADGYRMCDRCLGSTSKYNKTRRDERIEAGLCWRCGKEPLVEHLTVGERCRERLRLQAELRNQRNSQSPGK